MRKEINKDGSRKVRPASSGQKKDPASPAKVVVGGWRLAPDVAAFLLDQPRRTAYIEKLVRADMATEAPAP